MKQHTGAGLGGVLGLVVWILISPVSAFVIPSEVGAMYKRRGRSRRLPAGQACGSSRLAFSSFRRSSGS